MDGRLTICATTEIVDEYVEIVQEMIDRKQGRLHPNLLAPLIKVMELIEPQTRVTLSRDPDDDKFLGCAKDARAMYIVSGDKDRLVLKEYEQILIMTAREFCERFLIEKDNA